MHFTQVLHNLIGKTMEALLPNTHQALPIILLCRPRIRPIHREFVSLSMCIVVLCYNQHGSILDHPYQYSGETHYGNSNKITNNFESNYGTLCNDRPGGHTQQKPQPVRLRPVSELRRNIHRCLLLVSNLNLVGQRICFAASSSLVFSTLFSRPALMQ